MHFDEFDWGIGEVVYWEMNTIDPSKDLGEQIDELKEDLAQIQFGDRKLLDIGWYPEFSKNGAFTVTLVCDGNWDDPLAQRQCKSIKSLLRITQQIVLIAGK